MKRYEIESIEGVGYLVFEKINAKQTKRVDGVFLNIKQASDYLGISSEQFSVVHSSPAYNEMIGISGH
ncbi:hypothetical protein [Aliikangiella maris]|uniref:KilA-N domain-containing protein n=2 Tax=Aliikangiella maris TaxID=3162458 RepID=A0ABV2BXW7_9GAMM